MYTFIYLSVHISVCICIYPYAYYAHTLTHTRTHTHTHTLTLTQTHTRTHAHAHIYICIWGGGIPLSHGQQPIAPARPTSAGSTKLTKLKRRAARCVSVAMGSGRSREFRLKRLLLGQAGLGLTLYIYVNVYIYMCIYRVKPERQFQSRLYKFIPT